MTGMTLITLAGWQRGLRDTVVGGATATMEPAVRDDVTASAAYRLSVYANAYRLRLIEVLGNDFPVCKAWLGTAAFERCARACIAVQTSAHPSVRWFGRRFADWLRTAEPQPGLAELAAFEWAQGEAFDAADAELAVIDDLMGLSAEAWPALPLRLHPSARLIALCGNAPAQLRAHQCGAAIPEYAPSDTTAHWLLWRHGLGVRWRSTAADEAAALALLRTGAPFAAVCEALAAGTPDPAAASLRAARLLKRWIQDGLLLAFETPNGNPA